MQRRRFGFGSVCPLMSFQVVRPCAGILAVDANERPSGIVRFITVCFKISFLFEWFFAATSKCYLMLLNFSMSLHSSWRQHFLQQLAVSSVYIKQYLSTKMLWKAWTSDISVPWIIPSFWNLTYLSLSIVCIWHF